ncbi:hypothetical protein ACQR1W_16730 [Bradyrhizobium sp. HKCCYLS1011]|uniref:hypothetical protein n=1 Tax=Bradyrhizobium sp. HKCCYLS1011 TaxID=3420733 RepID=UPI003EC0E351
MSANDVNAQSNNAVEPLLPIEKKLIGYSLSLGIVLLVILVVLNHLYPAQL